MHRRPAGDSPGARRALARTGDLGPESAVSPVPHPPRQSRPESREIAELRNRRIRPRLRTPIIEGNRASLLTRLDTGDRLVDFEDLLVDWSEFRLVFRQTAEILHRSGALDAADHERLQALVRESYPLEELARDYYRRTPRPDRVEPPPADQPALADEVVALSLRPFLTRCAEAWSPSLDLKVWQRGYCPLCGFEPELATIVGGERWLICGRCAAQWPFAAPTCPFCGENAPEGVTSFASRDGRYRVYGCNRCRRYLKAYDGRGATRPVLPAVDAIATLPLDAAAIQKGYEGG
jgi:hypothetical protein